MEEFIQRARGWMGDPTVGRIIAAAITLIVVVVVTRLAQRTALRYIVNKDARYRVRKGIGVLGYLLAFLALGAVFSDRLGQFTVVFGVAGAGIAFALQEVIASIAGWAAIALGGFYSVGDRVQLGGIKGDVVDIGVLRTTLAEIGQWVDGDLYNGRMVRVANSFVFKEPVVNYSGDFPFLWDEMKVPIRHGSDRVVTERLLEKVAHDVCSEYQKEAAEIWATMSKRYPLEHASTQPMVTLGFDENWMTFTIRYPVRFDRRRITKHLLSEGVLSALLDAAPDVSLAASSLELYPMPPQTALSKPSSNGGKV